MNLDNSVIRVAALILKEVSKRGGLELDKLRVKMLRRVGADVEFVFLPALSFLYLLGKITYHPKNDLIEYVKSEHDAA